MMIEEAPSASGRFDALRLAAFGALGLLIAASVTFGPKLPYAESWVVAMLFSGIVVVVATMLAGSLPERPGLIIVIGIAIVLRLIVLAQEPALSTDIYRYIWDGRVQAAGINPYRYIPADATLAHLRDASIYPNINRADYAHTAYPPVAEFFFWAATRLGESTLVFRLVLVACEAIIVAILWDLLRLFRRPATLVVAYAWHPLAIWEVASSGHIDVFMTVLVMTGAWLLVRSRRTAGAVAIALAALVKPYAIVAAAAFWRPWDWRLPLVVAAVLIGCYLPYSSVGTDVIGFLPAYANEEGLQSGKGFWLVRLARFALGDGTPGLPIAYVTLALVTLACLGLSVSLRWRNSTPQEQVRGLALLLMGGLFFVSPNYAWYYLVLVPLIPIGGGAPAWVLTVGAPALYFNWPESYDSVLLWKTAINAGFLIALFGKFRMDAKADPRAG